MTPGGASRARPLLVLVHGWGFSARIWEPLRAALPGVDVLAPDLPGHGHAGNGGLLADPEGVAQWLLKRVPPGAIPVWAGWSLGGLVALLAARRWNGAQRLVLLGATPRFLAGPGWESALPAQQFADFRAALRGSRARLDRRLAMLCAKGGTDASTLAGQLRRMLQAEPAATVAMEAGLDMLEGMDLRSVWRGLQCPVAARLGTADALVPVAVADALLAMRPDARVYRAAGGHASWWREPEALARFLREETT